MEAGQSGARWVRVEVGQSGGGLSGCRYCEGGWK